MRLLLIFIVLLAPALIAASPAQVEQPPVIPRTTAVVRPLRAYADPTVPPEQTGLREVSLSNVAGAASRFYAGDPRFAAVDFVASLLAVERDPAQQDLVFIAQQSARLGSEHHRAFNLASAVSELESALETYSRTTRAWTHPDEVGDVLLNLALVELELAADQGDAAAEHEARAQEAFRDLVRIEPARVLDGRAYPPSVVEAYRRAYLSHFLDEGHSLRMRPGEAARLAELLDVDQLVFVFTLTDASRTVVVLQVYDAIRARFQNDAAFVVDRTEEAVTEAVLSGLSTAAACQPLLPLALTEEPESETGAVYLDLSFASGTYLDSPTERLFYNRGARLSVSWMLRETFGLYFAGAQWNAPRDPDGELLASLDTSRLALGITAGGRSGRLRIYGVGGLDIARVGRLRATDDFWCKVSQGEPFVFDAERRCDGREVTNANPQTQVGLAVGLGLDVQVVGPFWLHFLANSTVTVAPFEERTVGAPVGIDAGVAYRF